MKLEKICYDLIQRFQRIRSDFETFRLSQMSIFRISAPKHLAPSTRNVTYCNQIRSKYDTFIISKNVFPGFGTETVYASNLQSYMLLTHPPQLQHIHLYRRPTFQVSVQRRQPKMLRTGKCICSHFDQYIIPKNVFLGF